MQLIEKIEINYFRSLYQVELKGLSQLNTIFGKNDSGKSNIIRALKVFFEEEEIDFGLDFSDQRKKECEESEGGKRQYIWIKLTFRAPTSWQKSLGETFSVKKQWNKEGDMTAFDYSSVKLGPKTSKDIKENFFYKFWNNARFHHIPAVKSENEFKNILELLYSATSETVEISDAITNFSEALTAANNALSERLNSEHGIETEISAPKQYVNIFRELDFKLGDFDHSLQNQKGDGIKMKHIPGILSYVADHSSTEKFHIWGFEEPENSLDYENAQLEAENFSKLSMKENIQIFLTSHSPIFYNLSERDGNVSRYFVGRSSSSLGHGCSKIDSHEEAENAMAGAGLFMLPQIAELLRKNEDALESVQSLEAKIEQLQNANRPMLFIEGPNDVPVFERARDRASITSDDLSIISLNSVTKAIGKLLDKIVQNNGATHSSKVYFLFDNDKEGRDTKNKLETDYPSLPSVKFEVLDSPSEVRAISAELGLAQDKFGIFCEHLCDWEHAPTELKELSELIPVHSAYQSKEIDASIRATIERLPAGSKGWYLTRDLGIHKSTLNQSFHEFEDTELIDRIFNKAWIFYRTMIRTNYSFLINPIWPIVGNSLILYPVINYFYHSQFLTSRFKFGLKCKTRNLWVWFCN